jgi:hypothetical protein
VRRYREPAMVASDRTGLRLLVGPAGDDPSKNYLQAVSKYRLEVPLAYSGASHR